ncbi:LytR C-terminal domain-containing protein [Candidatus Woesebacteria bacterium]|nr:MAG: LytR C-terminal domain-containing protein [Candidatus Woesebacteria bacterium]
MPKDTKSKQSLDQIDSIESQLAEDSEEKVISVRIPKKKSEKEVPQEKEEKVNSSDDLPTHDEKESDTEKAGVQKDTQEVENVSSFSLLDADKKDEDTKMDKIHSPKTPSPDTTGDNENPGEAKTETPVSPDIKKDPKEEIKQWLDSADGENSNDEPSGNKLKIFIVFVIVAIVLGVIGGGLFYYQKNTPDAIDNTQVTPTPNTVIPSPTPLPNVTTKPLDLENISVSVLNGSGKAGEAGKAAKLLTDAGFQEATPDNADSSDFTITYVVVKKDAPDGLYKEISEVLGKTYQVELSDDILDDKSEFDAEVTIGSLTAQESLEKSESEEE